MMLALLALPAFADAPEPEPSTPDADAPVEVPPDEAAGEIEASEEPDWERVYVRASRVARAGSTAVTIGELAAVGGALVGSGEVMLLGLGVAQLGVPVMAGGSLRAWKALRELDHDVLPVAGAIATGLWGGQLLYSAATLVNGTRYDTGPYIGILAMQLGAVFSASIQLRLNDLAWAAGPRPRFKASIPGDDPVGALSAASAPSWDGRPTLSLAPLVSTDGTVGFTGVVHF